MVTVLRLSFTILMSLAAMTRAAVQYPVVVIRSHPITWESIRTNNIVESNETITCAIALQNVGEANAANVSASLLSSNGIASLTPEQSYGTLSTNDPAVSRDFTFTVSAA